MTRRESAKTFYPSSFPPDAASAWRRIRKYAVPRWMIDQAAERRLAGDWRGACEAANVGVVFDLVGAANQYGQATADRLEEDLRHLVPDLVRWHLPRYPRGHTTLVPGLHVLLARYADPPARGPYLIVSTPRMIEGSQRLVLRFGDIPEDGGGDKFFPAEEHNWLTSRYLWDVRHTGELRQRSAADDEQAERLTLLYESGEVRRAFQAADIDLSQGVLENVQDDPLPPVALARIIPELRLLASAGFGNRFKFPFPHWPKTLLELREDTGRVAARTASYRDDDPEFPEACWRRLPDLDLLRVGDITAEQLHPLVRASLFPGHAVPVTAAPEVPALAPPARVRCRGEWHEVRAAAGRLQIPHSADEVRREQAMRAFGGPVSGCFAAQQAWSTGTGRLPKALLAQRQEFFSYVQHGDTPAVLRLLDAGMDPGVRNGRRQTLLHLLHLLDHEVLLPRLLEAGLDLEARDQDGYTPLYKVVHCGGSADLVRALLSAGARTDVVDDYRHLALPDLIIWARRTDDLGFLKDAVERDYPGLAATLDEEWRE